PVNLVVARLGPVFGPWERTTGTRDTPSPHLQAARLAAAGRPAILPHPGRADWIYSRDVATGVVTLLDADRPRHRVYNVGAGGAGPAPVATRLAGRTRPRGTSAARAPAPERPPQMYNDAYAAGHARHRPRPDGPGRLRDPGAERGLRARGRSRGHRPPLRHD